MTSPRDVRKEKLRQQILDAAGELFAKEGYENLSMRKIAGRIGYSATTIYLHFQDKAALVRAICEESFARLIQALVAAERGTRDPLARLRRGLRAYIDFGLSNPHHYTVTFLLPHEEAKQPGETLAIGAEAFSHLRRGVAACGKAGRFSSGDVDLVSQALWTGVHGVTSLLIVQPGFPWVERERLIEQTLDSLLRGWLKA